MNYSFLFQRGSQLARGLFFALFLLTLLLILKPTPIAYAANFPIGCPGPATNNGTLLAFAITTANANNQTDTITLTAGCTYDLSVAGTQTILSDSNNSITIIGNGATISGGGTVRVFNVDAGATLTLQNVTVANGKSNVGSPVYGGGVYNLGTLNIVNSTFSNNNANSNVSYGGGVYNNSGTVNITNSTFSSNSATSDNSYGGALYTNGGTVTITGSTFANNFVQAHSSVEGGAIQVGGGTVNITNSTFSGNYAQGTIQGYGGALAVTNGSVTLTNVTLSSNSALTGGSGISQSGGTVTLINTIVASNAAVSNCAGTITDGGGNLQFGSIFNSCSGIPTPLLNPLGTNTLANNGGPTQTIALPASSDAINNAPANCPATDQRGFARLVGDGHCDSGAYEYGAKGATTTEITSHNPNPSIIGQTVTVGCRVVGIVVTSPAGVKAPRQTGSVTVTDGTVSCQCPLTEQGRYSTGSCNLVFTTPGVKNLTATYGGDAIFAASTSHPMTQTVLSATYLPLILR